MRNIWKKILMFFNETPLTNYEKLNPVVTYGDFFYVSTCPKCNSVLDEKKARYHTRCCYKCGYVNGGLFTCKQIIIRKKFINGVFKEYEEFIENNENKTDAPVEQKTSNTLLKKR